LGDYVASVGLLIRGRHELYVSSLAALLSSRGATVRVSPAEAELPARLPPGVRLVLLESPLPSELRRIAALGVPVIVLSDHTKPADRLAAAQLGARELLDKNATLAELMLAVRRSLAASQGGEPGILSRARYDLTPRQREVLGLIVEGLDNRQIAERLEITERTARAHVSAVLRQLGASNRTQAAVAAVQRGILGVLLLLIGLAGMAADVAEYASASRLSGLVRSAGGSSGAWAYDLDAGRRLVDWNGGVRRTPASVEKLLTTGAVFDRLGPDAQIETTALATGTLQDGVLDGNLYVQGHGDPSFGYAGLNHLAQAIAHAGIREITGRVLGDESFFDTRRGGPESGFGTSIWVGPLSALSFNGGLQAPYGHGFQPAPAKFVAARLTAKLEALGVTIAAGPRAGTAPPGAGTLAVVSSPPLASLVRHMNVVSDNYYAETLIKGLGAQFGGAGTTGAGAAVVRAFVRRQGFSSSVVDGSGLSRANSVSPRGIGRLLTKVPAQPWFDAFYRSLPVAGISGTLKKRMRGTVAAGRCRAKTGTLIAVSALAGYCRAKGGHLIAFAVLMNRVNIWTARRAQDRIAATLAAYRG
jgi:D-alanyl-D-alanine carboxypeptidase/D-alanyl-D-alanine-endopeptidase (penicillin-binding protein 4)